MLTILFIILGALLVRADGWGPENEDVAATWPKWKLAVTKIFNAWTSGACFALLTLIYTGLPLVALIAGLAFVLFRAPGFNGWENWLNMFWRGAWPTFIGFTILSLVAVDQPYYGLLFVPMAFAEMFAYSGSYKWLPGRVPQSWIHVIAELSSGAAFTIFTIITITNAFGLV